MDKDKMDKDKNVEAGVEAKGVKEVQVWVCDNCSEMEVKEVFLPGEEVHFTSSEFDYCAKCGNFTETVRVIPVRVGKIIRSNPSKDPSRSFNGGEYSFWEREVV